MVDDPVSFEVMRLEPTPVRLVTGMSMVSIEKHEGQTYEVSNCELKCNCFRRRHAGSSIDPLQPFICSARRRN